MQGLNKLFLMGHLGNRPDLMKSKNGQPYTSLSVATHRSKPNTSEDESEPKEITDWHYVHVWGKQAENCSRYLSKGQAVLVEGYISQYKNTREDGTDERKLGITATRVDFLPRANKLSEAIN